MRKSIFAAAVVLCVSLLSVSASRAAIVGEWDADDFDGAATWTGTADATVREGTPLAGTDDGSFAGFNLAFVTFGPAETAFEVSAANNAIAGLAEFSASVVFRTTVGGANGEDDFWRNQGLVGIELPGGGVGDWGVGIAAANNPLGGESKFTPTSVFVVQQGASRRGADTTATFWANAMLIGRELPGGDRGDYGLAINSEKQIILHESTLQLGQVEQLHASALSGGGLGFRITDIQFDPAGGAGGNGEITLTWASRPGATYAVFLSTGLIDWGIDVDDSVSSQGESTTLTFDHSMPGAARVFFRIQQ